MLWTFTLVEAEQNTTYQMIERQELGERLRVASDCPHMSSSRKARNGDKLKISRAKSKQCLKTRIPTVFKREQKLLDSTCM